MALDLETGEGAALIGASIIAVGTFMPWVRSIVVISGVDTQLGVGIVFGALVVGGIVLFRDWSTVDQGIVAAVGVGAILGAGWKYLDVREASEAMELGGEVSFSLVTPGNGLFVTMAGGGIVLGAAVVGFQNQTERVRSRTDP